MSTEKEKHIGTSHIIGNPYERLVFKQKEGSIHKKHLSQDLQHEVDRIDDLQNQIDSLEVAGVAVSNQFGDNQHISISQKALTAAINSIWAKLSDITGEVLQGISMTITPSYYIGEDGCTVHITARTVDTNGIFERLKLYINNQLIAEEEEVDFFEMETEITETSIIKCEAQILGIVYTAQDTVIHHASFWLGAGTSYAEIMDVSHVIPIANNMRGAYNITCTSGDHIYIVIASSLRPGFIRADINGVEIPFVETSVTIGDNIYQVFTSEDVYTSGIYNIDING